MNGPWDRPVQRATRLLVGLALFGFAMALLVKANLGVDPWNVFNQGVARHTGLSLGSITVLCSLLLLAVWIPLGERPGLGTLANALMVGPVLDVSLGLLPAPQYWAWRVLFLVAAIVGIAIATGLYVGAGWGPGPRDGLMTGLAARGVPVLVARTIVEVTVLVVGWFLGGSVGIATAVFAVTVGPLVAAALPRLAVASRESHSR